MRTMLPRAVRPSRPEWALIGITAIWGGRPTESEVGPAIYRDFLPEALRTGRYQATPTASVVGSGLAAIPEALAELRAGVSARKLVVTLP